MTFFDRTGRRGGNAAFAELDPEPAVAAARARLEALAGLLDSAVRIPGTSVRVGADAALNLIPVLGTLAAKALAGYIILEARRMGVPTGTLLRMTGNVGIDLAISAIPVAGWFGDIFYRANAKNIVLLKTHLDRRSRIIDGKATAA